MYFIRHISHACKGLAQNIRIRSCSSSNKSQVANRIVLISTSNSIYENLALEEWMYENMDLSETDYLLMWKNRPAVVLGRHQNPWLEANIPRACEDHVDVARRSSGGGTVYHDEGNLNLSFLKTRNRYNRKHNLCLVVEAIKTRWDLDLALNDRDDILLNRFYKVSGTAAKLGRVQSYHHFTLLVGVDTSQLWKLLDSSNLGVDSRATKSVPSTVKNLKEMAPDMTFELLVDVIGQRFLQEVGQKISKGNFRHVDPVNPTEFLGVEKVLERLQSWEWIFGKTPKFSIRRTFSKREFHGRVFTLNVYIDIEKGSAASLHVELDNEHLTGLVTKINIFYSENVKDLLLIRQNICDFRKKSLENFEKTLVLNEPEVFSVVQWIVQCVDSCFEFV